MQTLGTIVMVLGVAISAIGGIWLLITAFQESVMWGIGCLLFSPASLVFIIMHWDDAKKPFGLNVLGFLVIILGAALGGGGASS